MEERYKYLLMLGHLCTDINQGALPAIIPFLIAAQGIGYTSAAGLILASTLISSVVQPVFGYWGDKFTYPWLMSLGIVLAGGGIGAIGFCGSYGAAVMAAAISGVGIALFHPEGGKTANFASGKNKGTGIGVFAVGGNLGFVAGPIMTTVALSLWGLKGTIVFIIPAFIMAGILLYYTNEFKSLSYARLGNSLKKEEQVGKSELKACQSNFEAQDDDWRGFTKSAIVMCFRSVLYYGLITFIPLFFIVRFFQTEAAANTNLVLFTIAGVFATVAGGKLADHIGFRKIIRWCFFMVFVFLVLLLLTENNFIAILLVIPIGLAMSGSHSPLIAMGQGFLPNHIGFASGITLGLAVSAGGVCVPAIGWIGDTFGLIPAMHTIAGISFVAFLFTLLLSDQRSE